MKPILLAFLLIMVAYAFAQEESNPWSFSSNNSFLFYEGNVDRFDFYSSTQFVRADSNYELSASYKFAYGELSGVKNNTEHRGGITYDYRPQNTFSPFAGLSLLHNPFRGFDLRANVLMGLKYKFLKTDASDLSISAAAMYEYANFASPVDPTIPEKPDDNIIRLSIRPKFKITVDKFTFNHITFYKPLMQDFSDFLIRSETTMAFSVIEHLDLTINYIFSYNSSPAYEAILKRDQYLTFGVNVSF